MEMGESHVPGLKFSSKRAVPDHSRETGGLLGALQQNQKHVWGSQKLRFRAELVLCKQGHSSGSILCPEVPVGGQPPLVPMKVGGEVGLAFRQHLTCAFCCRKWKKHPWSQVLYNAGLSSGFCPQWGGSC